MLYVGSVIIGRNAVRSSNQSIGKLGVRPARNRRNGVSLLGLALAGAALFTGTGRADTLDLNGATVARVDFDQSPNIPYDIVQNGILQLTNNTALTFAGTLRDNGGGNGVFSLQKFGIGTLTLTGTSSYTGGTTLTGGTLGISNSLALGTGTVTINGPATLSLLGPGLTIANNITLTSDGTVLRFGEPSTLSGIISGAGALNYAAAGTVVITGSNTYTGGTQIGGGIFTVGNDQAFGTGAVAIGSITEFDLTASRSLSNDFVLADQLRFGVTGAGSVVQLNGVISGAGGIWLLPVSTGTLVLNNANSYTGVTVLSGGTLQVNDSNALGTGGIEMSLSTTLRAGAAGLTTSNNAVLQQTLTVDTNGNGYTLAGTIKDLNAAGSIRKIGAGTLTLSGVNQFSGGTVVEAGVVAISADAGLGASNGALTLAGGDLEVTGTATVAMSRGVVLSNPGAVAVDDANGILNLNGTVSGSGLLTKQGLGTLNLSGANSYSGGTAVTAGTLGVGSSTALGTGPLTLASATLKAVADGLTLTNPLTINNVAINTDVFNLTLTGPVGGTNFTKIGAGTLTLSGDNTLSSGIFVASGGLAVGSNTALGSNALGLAGGTSLIAAADGLVVANAIGVGSGAPVTLDTRATTLTLSGDINYSGNGVTLVKAGSGTLVANGSWFGGNQDIVNVAAGNLQVSGLINTGQLNVASGATLSGTGSVVLPPSPFSATVTIADGGNLSPGTATPGTLNVDNLALSAGSQVNFKLGQAGVVGGASNDLVVVHNQLTLAGVLNVANGPFFTSGTYTLFTYGTITDNGLTLGTLPSGYAGTVVIVAGDGAGGAVTLQALGNAVQYWDGSGAVADHVVSGGSGTWNAGSFNWASADGASNSVWNNQRAVFGTVGGAVNVVGTQQFTGLQFTVDGYHLSGDGLVAVSSDGAAAPEINTAIGTVTIVDNVITGTSGLLKSGLGTLTLNGNNGLSGPVTISGGRLNAGNNGALGSGAVELFNATTLGAGAALTLANALTSDGQSTVDSNGFALTLSGVLSGPGSLTITDTGVTALAGLTTLTGSNTYTGGTTISAARASIASDTALGNATGDIALNGGVLLTSASFGSARAVTLTGDSQFAPASATTLTLSGVIGGTGSLRQAGAGTLVLTGSNSYAGGTFVNTGILSVATDASLGAAGGGLNLLGGTLQLTGNFTTARLITIAQANTIDTGAFTATFTGPITDTGVLTKIGSGTLVLSGDNSSTAPTLLNQGTIIVGSNTAIGGGGLAMADGTTLAAGVTGLALSDAVSTAGSATIDPGNGIFTLNGIVSGPGSITKAGTGTLILNGANSFNGLEFTTGFVVVGTNTAAGSGSIALDGAAVLSAGTDGLVLANPIATVGANAIFSDVTFTLTGPIVGQGSITKAGSGNLVLDGNNSFSGGLTVAKGTVSLGSNTAGGGIIGLQQDTTLAAGVTGLIVADKIIAISTSAIDAGSGVFTLTGPISGSSITKVGSGNLVLNGDNSFAGLNLSAGTVTLGTNTASGGGVIAMADGTTLAAGIPGLIVANAVTTAGIGTIDSGAGSFTLGGPITGAGLITKIGAGNLVLNGNNDFAGLNLTAGTVTVGTNTAAGSGLVSLSAGTTLAAGTDGLVLGNAVVTQGATVDTGATSLALSRQISGAGGLTKTGSGTLTLSGGNSYAGATSVTAGTLAVTGTNGGSGAVGVLAGATLTGGGSIAGVVSIADGATIAPGNGVGQLTTGGLVLGNTANLAYELGEANAVGGQFNDLLVVNGNLTLGGKLSVTDSHAFGTGVYRLINYSGALTDNGLAINSLPGIYSGQIQTIVPGTVNLLVTAPNTLVQYWDGPDQTGNGVIDGGTGSWTTSGSNWTTAAPSTINSSWTGGVAVFTSTAGTVTVVGTQAFQGLQFITPGYVLTGGTLNASEGSFIATSGGTTTIASALTGGSITKQGAGTLALTGDNSFAALNITADTVSLGSNTAGGSGTIALADGTTLAGVDGVVLTNGVSTAGVGTLDSGAGVFTLNGVVSGPGSVAKTGSGNLVLNGANSFNGLGINTGTVTLGSNAAAGIGSIALADGTTLAAGVSGLVLANAVSTAGIGTLDSGAGVFTLSNTISGPGSITKAGSGNLVLNGDNGFTGLAVNAGMVTFGSNSAGGSGSIALADGTKLTAGVTGLVLANALTTAGTGTVDAGTGVLTLNGVVGGPGSITKIGTGSLVLNGANGFTGLAIDGGDVTVGNNSAAGNGAIAITGSTLRAGIDGLVLTNAVALNEIGTVDTQSFGLTLAGPITGQTLAKTGAGTLTLNGDNSYAGGTQLNAGQITVGSNTALGTATLFTQDGTRLAAGASGLVLNNMVVETGALAIDSGAGVFTLAGQVSGTGSITKLGSGNLVLSGNNSFTALAVSAGRVTAGAAGALGTGSVALADGTALAAGVSGLVLSNTVSTAGADTIDSGAGVLTLSGPVTGAGSVTKAGAGNLVLTGSNSYSGATTVATGTLTIDGANTGTGAVTAQAGTTLTGSGSIAGVVTVASGGTLAPGDGIGTLTTGGLVLASGASLAYQLGQTNVIGGPANDLLQVNGNLTLGGGLSVTDSGGFGSGVYRLIDYTGALTNNGLAVTSLPGIYIGQIQTVVPGAVSLLVTLPGALVQYWDGPDMAGNGKIDGGSGSWTATNSNWTTASPSTINSSWTGGVAVFSTTPGTVAVTGTQAFQGLQFTVPGYVLTGGTLNASAGTFIATDGGTTTIALTITGAGTGSGALSKQGAGNLVLNGSNSFAGLNVTAGTVTLGSNTAGGSGNIALANGTALAAGVSGLVLANTVSTAGVGTIDAGAGVLTLNGVVSGPGSIAKAGSGNLVLNGANGFNGLGVSAGTVTLGTNTAGGSGGIALTDGTTLAAGVSGLVLANTVSTAGVGTIGSGAGVFTLNGIVSGPGSIVKAGTGNLVLNGSNSFNGLAVNTGTVTLGTSTAAGVGGITLADGTALAAGVTGLAVANAVTTAGVGTVDSGAGIFTLNGVVSGPGSIAKIGSGNLVLNGANGFSGLAINTGTVTVGTSTAAGIGGIALANGATLAAGNSGLVLASAVSTAGAGTLDSGAGVFTLAGPVTGPGSVTKAGAGNLVLNGNNSFTGLSVSSGTVTVGSNTAGGTGSIALADGTTLAAGTSGLLLENAVSTAGVGTLDSGAGVFTLKGVISGPGSIAKAGSGNLVLNGNNSFAGLAVNAGTATIGTSTAAGTGPIALAGGTTLAAGAGGLALANAVTTAGAGTVNTNGFDLALNGPITGPGSIVETGGGSLTVAGVDSYAGATTVAAGQLRVTGNLTNSTVTVASGASLRGTGSVAGLIASSGGTVAPGLGTTIGTLTVTGNVTFQPGSTFAVNVSAPGADRLTVGGTATLAGALAVNQLTGPLLPSTTYTLLSAAGGRTGMFGTVSYSNFTYNAAFAPMVSYTANNVVLGLAPRSLLAQAGGGLTQNERNVAVAYDAATAAGFNPSGFAALFAPGLNLPDALNQLSGEVHSAERRVAMDDTRHVREAALDRLGAGLAATPGKDDSAATTEHDGRSYTLWARGIGSWGTTRSDGNGSSFNTSTGGAIVGVEMGFDGGKIGALFNYTTTTLDHYALGRSKVESTGGGIYAGYRQDHGFAAAAGAAVSGIKAHSSRTITIPGLGQSLAARSDGNTYQAFADVSYDLAAGAATRVEPFLRFAWVALDTAAFTETGGIAAVTSRRGAYTTEITTAGLRGAVALKGFTLKASAGVQHTGGDRSPAALLALAGDNSPASITAVPVDRWALAADVSGEFRLAPNATFAVGYSGVNGSRTRDNGVRGTLTFGF